jgi:sugar phosphate isomerase/epimerase
MEIGFLTWYFKETPLETLFEWADQNQFSGIELDDCPEDLDQVRSLMSKHPQVRVFALGRSRNYLFGTADQRQEQAHLLLRDIEAASQLGIQVINIFAGKDPTKTIEENLKLFEQVFNPLVAHAEKFNIFLAMENCAQRNWWPTGGNLAHTPELWRKLFEIIPSRHLGLTIDPSHFVWQGMDYLKATAEFGDRIYWAHAKDCVVHRDILADRGIYGEGWWEYRLPGWGELNWPNFFTALREIGYQGPIGIEHEDRHWNHGDNQLMHGLKLAQTYLEQFDY